MRVFQFLVIILISMAVGCGKKEPQTITTTTAEMPSAFVEKRVMVELFTSIRCGACPLAHHNLYEAENEDSRVFHISHQMFGSNPMGNEYTKYVRDHVKSVQFTPHAIIQRNVKDGAVQYYPPEDYAEISSMIADRGFDAELTVNVSLNDGTLDVSSQVATLADEIDEIRITELLVEKVVVGEDYNYHQRNYGNEDPKHPYFEQGDYIEGFEHTNVIRELITPYEGFMLDVSNNKSTHRLEHSLEDIETANFALVVFISNANTNQIFDARYIDLADL